MLKEILWFLGVLKKAFMNLRAPTRFSLIAMPLSSIILFWVSPQLRSVTYAYQVYTYIASLLVSIFISTLYVYLYILEVLKELDS